MTFNCDQLISMWRDCKSKDFFLIDSSLKFLGPTLSFIFATTVTKIRSGKIWIFYLGFLPFWYHIRPFDIIARPLLNLGLIVSNFDRSEILVSTWYYYNLLYFTIWSRYPEKSANEFLTHVKSETWPAPLILQFRNFLYGEISQ